MKEQHLYLLALTKIKHLGPVSIRNLIAYTGSPKKVFNTPRGKLLKVPGIGELGVKSVLNQQYLTEVEKEIEKCHRHNIQVLSYLDEAYPDLLKFIYNAPLVLYKKGKLDFNCGINIAIVGTRKPSAYGIEMAEYFAERLGSLGMNIVSGLAYGIDITAHQQCLAIGGKTTAVLAHGLDQIYPAIHKRKAINMLSKGAWLSEYPCEIKPEAMHFPARNRIVAGMCKATIVIEAGRKGGALITARMAFEQNREVYAIPGRNGDLKSEGCNGLIRDQIAKLVSSPEEVLEDLKIQWQHWDQKQEEAQGEQPDIHLSAEEIKILNLLNKEDKIIDSLMIESGIPMSRLHALLLSMEFKGLITQSPGKRFRRKK